MFSPPRILLGIARGRSTHAQTTRSARPLMRHRREQGLEAPRLAWLSVFPILGEQSRAQIVQPRCELLDTHDEFFGGQTAHFRVRYRGLHSLPEILKALAVGALLQSLVGACLPEWAALVHGSTPFGLRFRHYKKCP